MRERVFLQTAYDGSPYCGWQAQPGGISVQGELERALEMLTGVPVPVTGAGRTDAGVNAYGMVAHADLPEGHPTLSQIQRGVNGILRGSIAIRSIVPVHPEAHARFDARDRRYLYYISLPGNPFRERFCWVRRTLPDMERMNEAARRLIGEHDFTSFSKLHTDTKHNRCNVYAARWKMLEDESAWGTMCFEVRANRFLRGMVRAMVGTLAEVGYGKRDPQDMDALIDSRNRCLAGGSAPARGLFFAEAVYPDWVYRPDADAPEAESACRPPEPPPV